MSIFDRLLGKKPAPVPPTPEALKAVLAKATRVRIIEGGVEGAKVLGTKVVLDTSNPDDLLGLRQRLLISREPAGRCACPGGHAMELYEGAKVIAVFGLHHGAAMRWDAWTHDASLSGPDVFVSWLQHHGIPEPFEELRKARHAQRVSVVATTKWEAAAPGALKPLLADFAKGTIGATDLLLAMDVAVADEPEKARKLMKWFGSSGGKWNGAPAHEAVPEALLIKFRRQILIEAMMTDDGDIIEEAVLLEGAARFFSGALFLKERGADLGHFSKELKDRLRKHAKDSGEAEKAAQVEAAFKQVAAPAPAPKAEAGKKPAADDDDLL